MRADVQGGVWQRPGREAGRPGRPLPVRHGQHQAGGRQQQLRHVRPRLLCGFGRLQVSFWGGGFACWHVARTRQHHWLCHRHRPDALRTPATLCTAAPAQLLLCATAPCREPNSKPLTVSWRCSPPPLGGRPAPNQLHSSSVVLPPTAADLPAPAHVLQALHRQNRLQRRVGPDQVQGLQAEHLPRP